jgi:hypothetical protein
VRRLLCDGSIVPMTDDERGYPLDVGRKTRAIPPALRRALQSRDRGCRFPGCTNKRFTDGHHIEHWADGGETKLANLVLLCRVHHRLVHEEGFTVEHTSTGLCFRTPDGRRAQDVPPPRLFPHDPVLALITAHQDRGITARTCIPEWMGEKPEYDWITDALWRREATPNATEGSPFVSLACGAAEHGASALQAAPSSRPTVTPQLAHVRQRAIKRTDSATST